MLKYLPRLIFGSLLLCLILMITTPALACSPTEEAMQYTLEDRVTHAPMILVGTVVQGYTMSYGGSYDFIREVEVEVEQYLKGTGPSVVRIDGFGEGADCRSSITIGERAIFFVTGDPDTGLDAVYLGVHDATWTVNALTIATITGITGESNAPYPLPLTSQIMRFLSQNTLWLLSGILLVILLVMIPITMKSFRPARKAKAKRA